MKKILLMIFGVLLVCCMVACAGTSVKETATYRPTSTYSYKTPAPTENLRKKLDIEFLDSDYSSNYITLTYKITNNSSYHDFAYVKVKVSLLDDDDNVLTSDWTYAVDSVPLETGDSQEFDIMIKKPTDGRVNSYRCSIIEYD